MSTLDLIMEKRDIIRKIVESNDCSNPKVFGSVAREEDTEDSDIDIAITPTDKTTLWSMGAILWRLEELLEKKVDLVNEDRILPRFRPYIEKDLIDI